MKILLTICLLIMATAVTAQKNEKYVCLPCGQACDAQEYMQAGQCEHCGMKLVLKSGITHKNVTPAEVCTFISRTPNIVLLDVRTREEYNGTADVNYGTLKNAINIPVQELESRLQELEKHKSKTILVFCSHSHRSPRASYLLTQNGFKKVVNMSGGMSVKADDRCKR